MKGTVVIGSLKGWDKEVGALARVRPHMACVLVEDVASQEKVLAIVDKVSIYYIANQMKEQISRFIEEIGIAKSHDTVLGTPRASRVIGSDKPSGATRRNCP